jgi:hypothetical protein
MQDPVKFREYADECKKLAQTATGANRATLLRIAAAWIACAEDVERDRKRAEASGKRGPAGPSSGGGKGGN